HASRRRREDLARIGAPVRIEGAAYPPHELQIVGTERETELLDLLDADAVLAGDAAAELDAGPQDLAARLEHPRRPRAIAPVEEDDRVDVAVAGVEDVADAEIVARAGRLDAGEDLGEARARHDAVLGTVVRRQAADGPERALAALPERRAL